MEKMERSQAIDCGCRSETNGVKIMTAQISDTFIFQNEHYELIGIKGGELITPEHFGMEAKMMHTACYRGYYSKYKLDEMALYLIKFTIHEKNSKYVKIAGINPVIDRDSIGVYENLQAEVKFTGSIRLAKDLIDEHYVHMGFQKASAYKKVFDIKLSGGKTLEINDRSKEMEKKRGAFQKHYENSEIIKGIDDAFELDMDLE
jgi:hypothetical protein